MKPAIVAIFFTAAFCAHAQEASAGFELRATVSEAVAGSDALTHGPRFGSPVDAGFNAVFYPTWKLSKQWAITGVYDLYSRPYSYETYTSQGHGITGRILHGDLSWSRLAADGSIVIRAGELLTVFGSFPLRYDETDNPLIGLPAQYGYYYKAVSLSGVAGAQIDVTHKKWDARAQFANSSPSNPRGILASDQYGNWAGGLGYTLKQGFRVGASGYRGPYLNRSEPFYFKGEANPGALPARALGIDVQWAGGHWNIQGELQQFRFSYQAIPTFRERTGYVEIKRAINPRWYLALRNGFTQTHGRTLSIQTAVGFRPDRFQLIKLGYEVNYTDTGVYRQNRTLALQLVTSIRLLSLAR